MAVNNVMLIPAAELAPGALGAIRRQVTRALLARTSKELQLPESELVVRDLRPQADLDWGSNDTDCVETELTTELWTFTSKNAAGQLGAFQGCTDGATEVMGDQRFVAIYGLRDSRAAENTIAASTFSEVRLTVGNSIKAIWDLEQLYAYRENVVGVSSSAIIIPQNAQFQIALYMTTINVQTDIQIIGLVCEPRGKVISP